MKKLNGKWIEESYYLLFLENLTKILSNMSTSCFSTDFLRYGSIHKCFFQMKKSVWFKRALFSLFMKKLNGKRVIKSYFFMF